MHIKGCIHEVLQKLQSDSRTKKAFQYRYFVHTPIVGHNSRNHLLLHSK